MMPSTAPIMELTEAHRDGTVFVDGEGDLWAWSPMLGEWVITRQIPFVIASDIGEPLAKFGPYIAVLGPPEPEGS